LTGLVNLIFVLQAGDIVIWITFFGRFFIWIWYHCGL